MDLGDLVLLCLGDITLVENCGNWIALSVVNYHLSVVNYISFWFAEIFI